MRYFSKAEFGIFSEPNGINRRSDPGHICSWDMDSDRSAKKQRMSVLQELKKLTTIVADTGDFEGKTTIYI